MLYINNCILSKLHKLNCIESNQILHSDKYHQILVVGGPNIHNKSKTGDACHFEKNRNISATVWLINTKFCTMMHTDPLNHMHSYKLHSLKIQDGGWPPFWKSLNRHNVAMVSLMFTKCGQITHFGHLYPVDHKIPNFKIHDFGQPPFWKTEKLSYLNNGLTDRHKL